MKTPLLAIFIDTDNVPPKYADEVFTKIKTLDDEGSPRISGAPRIYGNNNNGNMSGWTDELRKHNLIPFHKIETLAKKSSADIAIVIDIMDLLHSNRFNGFCIVSSDSDYSQLAMRVREQGFLVYGFGEKKTSLEYQKACNGFVVLNETQANATKQKANTKSKTAQTRTISGTLPIQSAERIITHEMEQCAAKGEWVNMGELGNRLKRRTKPKFVYRAFGFPTLSKLLHKSCNFKVDSNHVPPRVKISNSA